MTKTHINIDELTRLAKEATPKNGAVFWYDLNRFNLAANPATVIALCEVVRAALQIDELCGAHTGLDQFRNLKKALANVEVEK